MDCRTIDDVDVCFRNRSLKRLDRTIVYICNLDVYESWVGESVVVGRKVVKDGGIGIEIDNGKVGIDFHWPSRFERTSSRVIAYSVSDPLSDCTRPTAVPKV